MNTPRQPTARHAHWRALTIGASLLLASQAWAQAPWSALSLTFVQPTGTALSNENIDVWLRLANTDVSEAFTVDNSLPNGGLNAADLPASAWVSDGASGGQTVAFAEYTGFSLGTGFGCSGSFTAPNLCDAGPPYTFIWGTNPFTLPFTLAAGAHLDYLWGRFTPTNGNAPAGQYEFYRSALWLDVYGRDANGHEIQTVVFPTQTCNGNSAAECVGATFMRSVTAVPEPESHALMLGGLAMLGWLQRRRRGG